MAWFWLSASIIAEVLATLALKASGGFTKHDSFSALASAFASLTAAAAPAA